MYDTKVHSRSVDPHKNCRNYLINDSIKKLPTLSIAGNFRAVQFFFADWYIYMYNHNYGLGTVACGYICVRIKTTKMLIYVNMTSLLGMRMRGAGLEIGS